MKKRLMAIVIAVFVMAAVTGCAKVTKLSDKDNDMVAEYIVGCILKHSIFLWLLSFHVLFQAH